MLGLGAMAEETSRPRDLRAGRGGTRGATVVNSDCGHDLEIFSRN